MKKRSIFIKGYTISIMILIALFNITLTAGETGDTISYADIDKEVLSLLEKGDIPGLSLAVLRGSGEVYLKGYGYADIANKVPVTPDTVFEIASCSKAFTALAALVCEAEGHLDLDDPVGKYLPWFVATYEGKEYRDITIRQFLNQTRGVPFK